MSNFGLSDLLPSEGGKNQNGNPGGEQSPSISELLKKNMDPIIEHPDPNVTKGLSLSYSVMPQHEKECDDELVLLAESSPVVEKRKVSASSSQPKKKRKLDVCAPILDEEVDTDFLAQHFAEVYFCQAQSTLDEPTFEEFLVTLNGLNDSCPATALYEKMKVMLGKYPDLFENFIGFLNLHQALDCGKLMDLFLFRKAWIFFRKLELCHLQKVYHVVEQFASNLTSTQEQLFSAVLPLLKGHPRLVDDFRNLFPGARPSSSDKKDFEDISGLLPSEDNAEFVKITTDHSERGCSGPTLCTCPCHIADNKAFCTACNIKFMNGHIYVQCGKFLRYGRLSLKGVSREDMLRRLYPVVCKKPRARRKSSISKTINPSKENTIDEVIKDVVKEISKSVESPPSPEKELAPIEVVYIHGKPVDEGDLMEVARAEEEMFKNLDLMSEKPFIDCPLMSEEACDDINDDDKISNLSCEEYVKAFDSNLDLSEIIDDKVLSEPEGPCLTGHEVVSSISTDASCDTTLIKSILIDSSPSEISVSRIASPTQLDSPAAYSLKVKDNKHFSRLETDSCITTTESTPFQVSDGRIDSNEAELSCPSPSSLGVNDGSSTPSHKANSCVMITEPILIERMPSEVSVSSTGCNKTELYSLPSFSLEVEDVQHFPNHESGGCILETGPILIGSTLSEVSVSRIDCDETEFNSPLTSSLDVKDTKCTPNHKDDGCIITTEPILIESMPSKIPVSRIDESETELISPSSTSFEVKKDVKRSPSHKTDSSIMIAETQEKPEQCKKEHLLKKEPKVWTREEDKLILQAFQKELDTEQTFSKISALMPSRTLDDIQERFQVLMNLLEQMTSSNHESYQH